MNMSAFIGETKTLNGYSYQEFFGPNGLLAGFAVYDPNGEFIQDYPGSEDGLIEWIKNKTLN